MHPAHAAFLAGADQLDDAAPDAWARRHAALVALPAAVWGGADLLVFLGSDDAWLQMFTLLVQAGWVSGTCVTFSASPLLVVLVAGLTTGPNAIGAAMATGAWTHALVPAALIHFSAMLRVGRSQGQVVVSLLEAEGRAARANAQLRALSLTDGLTGLLNRRGFDEALAQGLREAAARRRPIALLLADVDHFKQYNDHYGHPAGDACLARVAAALAGALRRATGRAARYGGEEFAAILPDLDEAGALLVAQRLRQALAAQPDAHAASPFGVVTVSIGVAAVVPAAGAAPACVIGTVDAALYDAKRLGRDRICVAARGRTALPQPEAATAS